MKSYLGIDVGGTKIKYGLYNSEGMKLDSGIVNSERKDLEKFLNIIENIKNKYENIEGIGMSVPCVLDSNSGVILEHGNIIALKGKNIKKIIEERLNVKVEIENDGNCVALAEKWIGNAKENKNFICITIGTGIGGAIVIEDKLYTGKNFVASEFGFMMIKSGNENNEKDYGHIASTIALVDSIKKLKDDKNIDGFYIFNKLKQGDEEIEKIYNNWILDLAMGIRNLCFVLDPEKVLIGGGISSEKKIIVDLQNKIDEILPTDYKLWKIEACKYFNESGVIGAIYNFIDKNKK